MRRMVGVLLTGAVMAAALGAVPAAADVVKSGTCGARHWRLDLSHDNGKIEADYELHNLKVGSTWRVVMKDNGVKFFSGTRTAGTERYIEVDKYTANQPGTDKITVRATNLSNGAVCGASASIS
jgi:hypothetical protein